MTNYSIIKELNLIIASVRNDSKALHEAVQGLSDSFAEDASFSNGMNIIVDFRGSSFPDEWFYGNDFDRKVKINMKFNNLVEIVPDNKKIIDLFRIFHTFKRVNADYYKNHFIATNLMQALKHIHQSEYYEQIYHILSELNH